jgi:hypothetical protein
MSTFQGDPAIKMTIDGATLVFCGGQPVMDRGLRNQALIALFTDQGWPGNYLEDAPENQISSEFERLARGAITLKRLVLIEQAAERALQSDIFGTVTATATNPESWRIDVEIVIEPPGGEPETILLTTNGQNWLNQAADPAYRRLNCKQDYGWLSWDDETSDDTILRLGSAVIAIAGDGGPFTWDVTGTGFSLENSTTTGLTNQLNADGTACGVAEITVINAQGLSTVGYVREPNQGQWVSIGTGVAAQGYVSGVGVCVGFCGNQNATGAYGGIWELAVGKYKLRERWSFVELSLTCPVADEVEVEVAQPTNCGTLEPGWGGQGTFPCCVEGTYVPTRYAAFYLKAGDKNLYEWQC